MKQNRFNMDMFLTIYTKKSAAFEFCFTKGILVNLKKMTVFLICPDTSIFKSFVKIALLKIPR